MAKWDFGFKTLTKRKQRVAWWRLYEHIGEEWYAVGAVQGSGSCANSGEVPGGSTEGQASPRQKSAVGFWWNKGHANPKQRLFEKRK